VRRCPEPRSGSLQRRRAGKSRRLWSQRVLGVVYPKAPGAFIQSLAGIVLIYPATTLVSSLNIALSLRMEILAFAWAIPWHAACSSKDGSSKHHFLEADMFLINNPALDPFRALANFEANTDKDGKDWFTPSVDILESKDGWKVLVDLPGLKREDIRVELEQDALIIEAEAAGQAENPGWEAQRLERVPRAWRRAFNLGENISRDDVKAAYENGVLSLELKKVERAKAQRIIVG
jgi:HSP20 family protein